MSGKYLEGWVLLITPHFFLLFSSVEVTSLVRTAPHKAESEIWAVFMV